MQEKAKYVLNPDQAILAQLDQELKENGNYCPCTLERSTDTICPCLEYRQTGECICGKFIE